MTEAYRDHRALAREITWLTGLAPAQLLRAALATPWPDPRGLVVGVTGPAGAGKSTLVAGLVERLLAAGEKVAVVAVDPTLASGGAVLGDRVRLALPPSERLFWRSLATRGSGNALWAGLPLVTALLLRAGFDRVLVETAGAGQDETGIADQVDALVLVLTPLAGDEIQHLKNGLLETAAAVVINRCDEANPAATAAALTRHLEGNAVPPAVIRTTATTGAGLDELTALLRSRTARQPLAAPWKPAAKSFLAGVVDALPDGIREPMALYRELARQAAGSEKEEGDGSPRG